MITIIILFFMGYIFHWCYRGLDNVISALIELKRKRDEK